jgi:hypothetical protein
VECRRKGSLFGPELHEPKLRVRSVSTCWCYVYPLNFYRLQSKHSLSTVSDDRMDLGDAQAYVLNTFFERDTGVLDRRELKIIYRRRPLPGRVGNTVIAVKPELAQALLTGPCSTKRFDLSR